MLQSSNIESIHATLDRHIRLIAAYSEMPELNFIIRSARLKPYHFLKKYNPKLKLYDWWIDEYGNSLTISKNKKIEITLNDLRIDRSSLTCTDLYQHIGIDKVVRISKLLYYSKGIEEDFNSECISLNFLGIDNFLRNYIYIYDKWEQYSSLVLGSDTLKNIANNQDIKIFTKLKSKISAPYTCTDTESWIGLLPATKEFVGLIREKNDFLIDVLKIK